MENAPIIVSIVLGVLCAGLAVMHLRFRAGRGAVYLPPKPGGDERDSEMLKRQKLEIIGEIAAGVIHDFNNTLTSILGYAELIGRASIEGSQQKKYAECMIASANSAIRLMKQIQAFKKGDEARKVGMSVHVVVEDVVDLLKSMLKGTIRVSTDLAAAKDVVEANPTALFQVFLNLAVNARDAMPAGGDLRFATRNASVRDRKVVQETDSRPGNILVSVRDSGQGIPHDVAVRLFEPFFTTKPAGTGLGLAVVRRTLGELGGDIWFETAQGKGTTFFVSLPLSGSDSAGASTTGGVIIGSGRILIADGDEFALDAMSETVKALGYSAVGFSDFEGAASFYRDAYATIQVVLIDRDSPGGGEGLFRRLLALNPSIKAFLATTGDAAEKKPGGYDRNLLGVLQKPLNMSQISRMLDWAIKKA